MKNITEKDAILLIFLVMIGNIASLVLLYSLLTKTLTNIVIFTYPIIYLSYYFIFLKFLIISIEHYLPRFRAFYERKRNFVNNVLLIIGFVTTTLILFLFLGFTEALKIIGSIIGIAILQALIQKLFLSSKNKR